MIRRTWTILGALLVSASLAMPVWAEDADLERRLQDLERKLQELEGRPMAPPVAAPPRPAAAPEEGKRLQELAEPRTPDKQYGSTMQGSGGLIYARPFVASPKAIVGGYTDIEYFNRANNGGVSFFDQHRLVPFIYGDVSDRVKFAAEIEIEHGGRDILGGGQGGMELGVEFMAIDYLITEPLNLRAGVILLPLGKFNLLHDAPLRDLTDRPLVDQFIIPAALRQAGIGMYGTFYPTRLSKLDYEVYLTNGFTGFRETPTMADPAATTGDITGSSGLRGARLGRANDNNEGKSWVGRVAFSPILGIEVGGSGFYGSYDPRLGRKLSIYAVDWTFQRGPWELIGEAAWAHAEDNRLELDGTTPSGLPERMNGYYVQVNYHFLPEFLVRLAPSHFRPEVSTFTAVVRWEETDLGQGISGNSTQFNELQRATFGLNFRPTEDTVMKVDFLYSPKSIGSENGGTKPVQDTA
ncbi:MAG: hypothetical protein ACREI3_02150, partial [Nitrospirales bacterium]